MPSYFQLCFSPFLASVSLLVNVVKSSPGYSCCPLSGCDCHYCYPVFALRHFTISQGLKEIAWNFHVPGFWLGLTLHGKFSLLSPIFLRVSLGGKWAPACMKREMFSFECCLSTMLCSQALKCSRRGICVLFVTFETIYMNWAT